MPEEIQTPTGDDIGDKQVAKCDVGDVVTLRSGGPLMTVVKSDGETIHCIWFGADESVRTAEIPRAALESADDEFDFDASDEEADEDAEDGDDGDEEPKKKKSKKKHED